MNKKILFLFFLMTASFNISTISSKEDTQSSWFNEILKRQDSSLLAPSTVYIKIFVMVFAVGFIVKKIVNHQSKNTKKINLSHS